MRVLVAGAGPDVEAALRAHPRVAQVRPCADIVELRAVALALGADFAVLGPVAGLDRGVVRELTRAGIRPVGLLSDDGDGAAGDHDPVAAGHADVGRGDDRRVDAARSEGRGDDVPWVAAVWRRLEVRLLLRVAGPHGIDRVALDALLTAGDDSSRRPRTSGAGRPAAIAPRPPAAALAPAEHGVRWRAADPETVAQLLGPAAASVHVAGVSREAADTGADGPGSVLAVWGPTGAPGRSLVAAGLAAAAAARGVRTLLVDADPYGGTQAAWHGQLDDAPGLLRAARLAARGRLDEAALADCTVELPGGPALLTGLRDPAAWPRLRPAGLEAVLDLARGWVRLTVVDCGFCLEEDEELSYDTAAPARNGATLAALRAADRVVAVATPDPLGSNRLRVALSALHDLVGAPVPVVLNRVATHGPELAWARETVAVLRAEPLVAAVHGLPDDPAAAAAVLASGRSLFEAAAGSDLASATAALAATLMPELSPPL